MRDGRVVEKGPGTDRASADRPAAFSWRDFEPGSDTIPPAPGLPPVSTLKRPHPARRRMPWLVAIGGLLYALTIALWVLYR